MNRKQLCCLALMLAGLGGVPAVQGESSHGVWAYPGPSGRIICPPDALGNRILDYTAVGYSNGLAAIPDVPVKISLSPQADVDNGPLIQGAINYVAGLPLVNGFRGAVFLNAGEYAISNSITINASGIVLRGAGDGTNGTILFAAGPRPNASVAGNKAPLIFITGSGSGSTSGTVRYIADNYVPVGAYGFAVNSTSGLSAGQRVMITRPSPANWIQDIGMDLVSPAWTAGDFNVPSERFITRLEGNRVMLDAPLTCALEAQYGGGTIQPYAWPGRIYNVGVEDIRGISDFDPSITTNTGASSPYYCDELHALDFIEMTKVENAWVRRATAQYFGYACVHLSTGTRCVTVRDCNSLDPVSIITGERRYAFALADAYLCLVQNCYTRQDRHQFVTDSLDTGPNVFVDGLSDAAHADAGPHFRWGTGAIWDNVTVNGNQINVRNRGNAGTSHGWAGANEVVWNSRAASFIVESPVTARNWLIGGIGPLAANSLAVGPHPVGTVDSPGTNVFPNSLYYAELQDRLAAPGLQTRAYWTGQINQFASGNSAGEMVPVNTTWRTAVQTAAGSASVTNFDIVGPNQWVPFTFNYAIGATDRIVGATLSLAMRSFSGGATNEVLYLNSLANSNGFASLGWLPIGSGTNTTARVLDLGSQLDLLTNGGLNVAVAGDVGIDWAMLELQVAPARTFYTNSVLPAADAYVNGGVSAEINYGTTSTLLVKTDASANVQRKTYLRWSLNGDSPNFQRAVVRLMPVAVGTNGYENGITVVTNNDWNENAINWNNQPGGGKRFATWMPVTNVPVEVTVTPQAQSALMAGGQLSLELYSLSNDGGSGVVSYGSRENSTTAFRPQLLLFYTNPVPGISAIDDQAIPANTSTAPLAFTVGDPVSSADQLTLGAVSSNPALVSPANMVFGGSFSNRTVTVTPVAGQTGSVRLTILVTNSAGMTAGSQFTVTVTNAAPPIISAISDQAIALNTHTGPVPFTVGDPVYPASQLTVGAVSANPTLVPPSGFIFGGALSNLTLDVTPASNQTGSVVITVTVTNPAGATASSPFTLTVTNAATSGLPPASGSWDVDAGGNWSDPANWLGGIIATGADMTATFGIHASANRYIDNDAASLLGNLMFSDANSNSVGAWVITNQPITLQVSSGAPVISVSNVPVTIASSLQGAQGFNLAGGGTLVLSGNNLNSGLTSINDGLLVAANDSALGDSSGGAFIKNVVNATLGLAGGITLVAPVTLACKPSALGPVAGVINVSGTNTLAGPISLTTGGSYWTFEAAAGKLNVTGAVTNVTSLNVRTIWLRGAAAGEWSSAIADSAAALSTAVRKDDIGTWTLSGNNTYTGNTVVSNGTLLVSGIVAGGTVMVYGGTLGGSGTVLAPVTIFPGATFAPGGDLSALTISNNLSLSNDSMTAMEINAQTLASSVVQGISNVIYAGTLSLTNVAGALAAGQTFSLFQAVNSSGNFTNILPASPGPNLAWSFAPASGQLNVVSLPPPQVTNYSVGADGSFHFSGTGPAGQGYRIFATTNLALPFNQWTALVTDVFVGGIFNFTDSRTTNYERRFYQVKTP